MLGAVLSARQTNPCLKSLKSKWGTASRGGRGGVGSTQVCHSKGQKQHRTEILIFLTQISAPSVTARELLSCKANQTFLRGICLSPRMLALPNSAMFDCRLEGQTTCYSITPPRLVLGFALLL